MKATELLHRDEVHSYIDVAYGSFFRRIKIPRKLRKYEVRIEEGKVMMGRYTYNESTDTWEKISKILLFLQSIVEAIKNIFK